MSGNTSLGFTLQFQVWINICTSVAARHPWDMKAITVGVLYKTKRLICWGAVVVQRQTRLVGSICSSFWVVLEGHGAVGFGCWRDCHSTAPRREFKHASTSHWFLALHFLGHGSPRWSILHGRMRRRNADMESTSICKALRHFKERPCMA